ncbi:hypothetical protein O181_082185 [Austropuccinia psidii MF-1]|uniref:Uncharacterized protein n=1 Tax=Austropuccinia psidii MF-1 TaxID=1389203 RepID=A0A9Q3IKL6_9BASI|nr:hypothetical protein [Austropuccinia psidii MF-1]
MGDQSNCFLVPRTSLRSPAFFGPVTIGAALMVASIFTAPFDDDFSLVKLKDPTFYGTLGLWGACSRYHQENATTANPFATLTGNATIDAIIHNSGKHRGCSSAAYGWSFSVPVNNTGLAGMPLPNSTLGFNMDSSVDSDGLTWVQVMSKSQSQVLIVHVVAGLLATLGLLLLIIPYKPLESSMPGLYKFLKAGSLSLVLIILSAITSLIAFIVSLTVAKSVQNNINSIGNGDGLNASLGNIMWFSLAGLILFIPSIWSTRGQ